MKNYILAFIWMSLFMSCNTQNNKQWEKLKNTTWISKEGNERYVFFNDKRNEPTCIIQLQGYGVYTMANEYIDPSRFHRLQITEDTILFEDKKLIKIHDYASFYDQFNELNTEEVINNPSILKFSETGRFCIYFFHNQDPFAIKEYGDSSYLHLLRNTNINDAACTITDTDIELYNFKNHKITLNSKGIEKISKYVIERDSTHELVHDIFIVSLYEHNLYAGIICSPFTAMIHDFPVIRTHQLEEDSSMQKGIIQIAPSNQFEIDPNDPIMERISNNELREFLKSRFIPIIQ